MRNRQTSTIKILTVILFLIVVQTSNIFAQYGNLLSKQAADAMATGDPQLCWDEMYDLTVKEPKNSAAQVERARCFLLALTSEVYKAKLKRAIMVSENSEAKVQSTLDSYMRSMPKDLRVTVDAIIAEHPKYAPAYNLRGLVNKFERKQKEAQADFDLAISLDAKNYRAYTNRGKLKDDAGDAAGAIADYEKVVALGVNDPFITKRLPELKKKAQQKLGGWIDEDFTALEKIFADDQQNAPEVYKYPNDKVFFGVPREKLDIFLLTAVSNSYQDCTPDYSDFIVSQKMERPGRTPFTRIIKKEGSKPLMVVIAVGNELTSIKLTPWNGGGKTQIFDTFEGKEIGWTLWAMLNAPVARPGLRFAAIEIRDRSVDYTAEAVRNDDNYTYISRFFCTAKK